MGLMASLNGTLSLRRNRAMSLSKLRKLKSPVSTLTTYLVSAPFSIHLSCSPNVTLIMNHMNLKTELGKLIMPLRRTESVTGKSNRDTCFFCQVDHPVTRFDLPVPADAYPLTQ